MDDRHKKFYRKYLKLLTETIKTDQLLGSLFSYEVITIREQEELRCMCRNDGNIKAGEKLIIEILWKKPNVTSMFEFTDVLHTSEHKDLVVVFMEEFPELWQRYPDLIHKVTRARNQPHGTSPARSMAGSYGEQPMGAQNYATPQPGGIQPQVHHQAAPMHGNNQPMQGPYRQPSHVHQAPMPSGPFVAQPMDVEMTAGARIPTQDFVKERMTEPVYKDPPPQPQHFASRGEPHPVVAPTQEEFAMPAVDGRHDLKETRQDRDFMTELSKYVCNITCREKPTATGFVIGSIQYNQRHHFLIMTNNHVYKQIAQYLHPDPDLSTVQAVFDLGTHSKDTRRLKVYMLPDVVTCDENLDYALILLHYDAALVRQFGEGSNKLGKFIHPRDDQPVDTSVLILIGHPLGEVQTTDRMIVNRNEAGLLFPDHQLVKPEYARCFYRCTSQHGSSGSPCFDVQSKRLFCLQSGDLGGQRAADRMEHGALMYTVVRNIQEKMHRGNTRIISHQDFYRIFPDFVMYRPV